MQKFYVAFVETIDINDSPGYQILMIHQDINGSSRKK
jgi:hypothetical protein